MDESIDLSQEHLPSSNEMAVTTCGEINPDQALSLPQKDAKKRNFSKRKIILVLSLTIVVIAVGIIGVKYYLNYQENQRAAAAAKAIHDAALKASKAAFDSAQLEITPDLYKEAITDLKKVIPDDPQYSQAQKQVAILNSVSDISSLIQKLNGDREKANSEFQQLDKNRELLRDSLNSAIQGPLLTSSAATPYIKKLEDAYNQYSTTSDNIIQDMSQLSNDIGLISSNTYLSSFSNSSQILSNYQDMTNQVMYINSNIKHIVDYMKSPSSGYNFSDKNTNTDAYNRLFEDSTNIKQEISSLTGFSNGKINNLLEEAKKLNQ
ncbi:hypothetical protein REC12_11710 [Desulfosporosinus sp. PR]|uniref:hypothetical protein n=1 Tax=Candidatus Desulfosporosinus nitrosoreducens TaxID=3401928 RepID=UPI0027EA88C8|nr:hypothetical protein [Desulfosporosinus sp. PR]MDQ7094256.1 hypothetical protein [Desulfosporosinus sp. PR]